jgi:hypothetical protein
MSKIIVSPSRIEEAARCYRRHVLGNQLGLTPLDAVDSPALVFGTVTHAATAALWTARFLGDTDDGTPYDQMMAAAKIAWAENEAAFTDNKHTFSLLQFMLEEYHSTARLGAAHYAAHREDEWVPVLLEKRLEAPLGTYNEHELVLSFQIDRLALHEPTGSHIIADTKTSSPWGRSTTFSRNWSRQWVTSIQQKLYKWGVKEVLDITADGYIEGMLKHVPTEVRYVACPEWDEEELHEVKLLAHDVAINDARLLDFAEGGDLALYSEAACSSAFNYADCFNYGRECAFYRACTARPAERAGVLMADYERLPQDHYF